MRPTGSVQFDNSGRVVLVTGGAGGIGLAICQAFAASGATVYAVDVAEPEGELPAKLISGDVSKREECRRVIAQVVEEAGAIDVLVNNAAIQPPASYKAIDELSTETWDKMVAINLSGYAYMAMETAAVMRKQQSGVIVNMASAQAHRTAREVPAYGPIKAANVMQAKQWGVELAREGVRVVSVSPGAVGTPLLRASLAQQGGEESLANRHPLGRIGEPPEIAAAVLWLASEGASFITATDIEVDGGLGAFAAFADPFSVATLPGKNDC
ncbi:SDR family NAD(P)-dependent oxidoreductase [Blastopirellula retiformator]|uniref:2,3-dihydro-2,3-dihydroxybenzoate dehydrogenase n=1 Tax=Blastopirellula retiformator TaxID=2527970 RepID=A0A5C5VAZ1_9BACT|nr:SDR family oxidoreductase [Blastopirellula retiformator]TWT34785.1 2,3-dihydro-2,3-dihydroxybenzoate dehydrogenase [Blastopirellula retiformator]